MTLFSNSSLVVLAYLDPGSGSFLIQMLLAGGLGAAFLIKTYWRKIKTLFGKNKVEETHLGIEENTTEE